MRLVEGAFVVQTSDEIPAVYEALPSYTPQPCMMV